MADKSNNYGPLLSAGLLAVIAIFAGSWRMSIKPESKLTLPKEGWERIHEAFPLPPDTTAGSLTPTETYTEVIAANPFSPQRRQIPEDPKQGTAAAGKAAEEPVPPKFVYKGRMQLGSKQRAILEDLTIKKTYFLEVGQGVANFKVLDIDEKRVILSDPQTHEEVTVSLTTTALP